MMRRSVRLASILSPTLLLGVLYGVNWSIIYILCLGFLALGKVLYYSMTFNDCHEASESLLKEIVEARIDLTKRGFNFMTQ